MYIKTEKLAHQNIAFLPTTLSNKRFYSSYYKEEYFKGSIQAFWCTYRAGIVGACMGIIPLSSSSKEGLSYEYFLNQAGVAFSPEKLNVHNMRENKISRGTTSMLNYVKDEWGADVPPFHMIESYLHHMLEEPLPEMPEVDGWYRLKK